MTTARKTAMATVHGSAHRLMFQIERIAIASNPP
jgi:hypothetical protein